ncbi:MAG: ATP synthase F1 subunit delta [Gemmataceae bacterium]|nr:ATP synthase F1 subunit delta [Gemmataceae bacterium]
MTQNASYVEQVNTPGAMSPEEMAHAQQRYEEILLQTDSSRVAGRLARTYAEALLAVAEQRGEADAVAGEFDSLLKDVFPAVAGLEDFLDTPAVNKHAKDEALARAFGDRASPLFLDFLRLLNRKDRLGLVRLVAVAYRALRDKKANRQRVLVESATPLDAAQKTALRDTLAAALNKTPVLVVRENPDLIGGLVVHVGDKVYDTSVRSKLQAVRHTLLVRGSHAIQSGRDRFSHR